MALANFKRLILFNFFISMNTMHIAQTSISFGGGGVLAAIMRDQFQERTDPFFLYHSGIFCVPMQCYISGWQRRIFNVRYNRVL